MKSHLNSPKSELVTEHSSPLQYVQVWHRTDPKLPLVYDHLSKVFITIKSLQQLHWYGRATTLGVDRVSEPRARSSLLCHSARPGASKGKEKGGVRCPHMDSTVINSCYHSHTTLANHLPMHADTCTHTDTCTRVCMHTQPHKCAHTHTHTHTQGQGQT